MMYAHRFLNKETIVFYTLILVFSASGCAQKIDVFTLPITDAEKQEAEAFSPTVNIAKQKRLFIAFVSPENTAREKATLLHDAETFYKNSVEKYAHFIVAAQQYPYTERPSTTEFLERARSTDMDYAVIYRATLLNYDVSDRDAYYEIGITADFYHVRNRRLIAVHKMVVTSNKKNDAKKDVKTFVVLYFPIRGFVTETRGDRQVAKLDVGSVSGLAAGDNILFRNTNTSRRDKAKNNALFVTDRIEYSDEIIGYGEIILLNDNFSWVKINSEKKAAIQAGVAGFLYNK